MKKLFINYRILGTESYHDSPAPSIHQLLQHHFFPEPLTVPVSDSEDQQVNESSDNISTLDSSILTQDTLIDTSPIHHPVPLYENNK